MNHRTRPVPRWALRLGQTRLFLHLAPHLLPRCDRFVHRVTRGRWMPSRLFLPVIQLTTTGHRTGLPRHTPICAHHATVDGTWLIVASNFGRPHHPAWSTNLLHHPHAAIAHGGPAQPVTARLLTPHEQAEHRARILAALPVFDSYAARARRDLRIFLLTPTPPS